MDGSSARERVVRTRWGTLGRLRAGFTGLEQSSGARSEVWTPFRVIGAVSRVGSFCPVVCFTLQMYPLGASKYWQKTLHRALYNTPDSLLGHGDQSCCAGS